MYDSRSSDNGHNKRNREHGWGDYCEWNTPRSRRLATREQGDLLIAEGLDEHEAGDLDLPEPRECSDEIVLVAALVDPEVYEPLTPEHPLEAQALSALRNLELRMELEIDFTERMRMIRSWYAYAQEFSAEFGYSPSLNNL